MKDDYLWDKTGNDSEIEWLENSLRAFRSEERDAPKIPANVLSFKKEKPQTNFPIFRALAAGFAFAFILTAIALVYFKSKPEIAIQRDDVGFTGKESQTKQSANGLGLPEKTEIKTASADDKFEDTFEKPKTPRQKFKVQKLIYKPKPKHSKVKTNYVVKLTEEEKEAYEKLMLALSITSSKLRIVKDKVQNLDDQTAINTGNEINKRKK